MRESNLPGSTRILLFGLLRSPLDRTLGVDRLDRDGWLGRQPRRFKARKFKESPALHRLDQ
jgi:hypothetical protein